MQNKNIHCQIDQSTTRHGMQDFTDKKMHFKFVFIICDFVLLKKIIDKCGFTLGGFQTGLTQGILLVKGLLINRQKQDGQIANYRAIFC